MNALWTSDALRAATGGVMLRPFHAGGISIDTRSLAPGDLFVALRGEHGDGHAHVGAAFARGAAGAMVDHADDHGDHPLLHVGDTLDGLRALGEAARARFTGQVAAITGSVGKTTTKEMLRLVLGASGPTHAAHASYNNHWGVPLTLARMPEDAAYGVIEIGMNHAGEIGPLALLAQPDVAVITAIAPAHIGHLGSLEAIADEKAAILEGLGPDGVAVLPADGPHSMRLRDAASGRSAIRFGEAADATWRLVDAVADGEGSLVTAMIAGEEKRFRLGARGRHMAVNALAALATAAALGADWLAGMDALAQFRPVAGRGARRALLGGRAVLLDESYNASSGAVRAALALLGAEAGRRVAVLGDMLELGAHGPAEHESLVDDIAAHADLVFVCGELMGQVFARLPASLRGARCPDSDALAPIVAAALAPGDAVLVKGSLGMCMARVVDALVSRGYDALAARDGAGGGVMS